MMSDSKLFDLLPEPTSRLSPDLAVLEQNSLSVARHGRRTGEPCHRVHFGRDEPCAGCHVRDVLSRGYQGRWFLSVARDGRPSYYEITVVPVKDDEGRVVELIEFVRDATVAMGVEQHFIRTSEGLENEVAARAAELAELTTQATELRDLMLALRHEQAAMLQTEKMASLGSLAAGLAHEIHTPLGALLSNLDLLRRGLTRLEAVPPAAGVPEQLAIFRRLLDLQQTAAERIHRIIRSLREFSHLDRAVEEEYDLHLGIDAALALLQHLTRDRIEVVRDLGDLPRVRCRPDAINQVFMNLLQNAVQAIEGQGTIRVRTSRDGSDHVLVEVSDTGRGIAPENLRRVFEPGFTTKPRGIGTGLGLAITYSTVRDHGGSIDLESECGRGTVFRVRLPVRGKA